jgi:hypothetical protein
MPSLRLFINRAAGYSNRYGSVKRPQPPRHYYSNSELKQAREHSSALKTHKAYNPFLSSGTSYRTVIESNVSHSPPMVPPKTPTTEGINRKNSVKETTMVTVARPESPHLHSPYFSPHVSTLNIDPIPSHKHRKDNSIGAARMAGSVRPARRRSLDSVSERGFGNLGTALPAVSLMPQHGGVIVTTEYEVESYRHSLGSTIRSHPLSDFQPPWARRANRSPR